VNDSRPFPLSFFCDGEKPPNLNLYLEPFLNELKPLEENGIDVNDRHLMGKLIAFICDASARSLVKRNYWSFGCHPFRQFFSALRFRRFRHPMKTTLPQTWKIIVCFGTNFAIFGTNSVPNVTIKTVFGLLVFEFPLLERLTMSSVVSIPGWHEKGSKFKSRPSRKKDFHNIAFFEF
jgi:hypothetical protein